MRRWFFGCFVKEKNNCIFSTKRQPNIVKPSALIQKVLILVWGHTKNINLATISFKARYRPKLAFPQARS
jgi:hypothetical protein